jgi:hypothetical protein
VGRRQWSPGNWRSLRPGMRPRVLVESSDAAEQWAMEEALRGAGYEVAVCDGPSVYGAPWPLVRQGECALAAGADVIVNGLPLGLEGCQVMPFSVTTAGLLTAVREVAP